jgi:hypothetical protein
MTLEKPPWGKPVEEEIYYGVKGKITAKITSQLSSS